MILRLGAGFVVGFLLLLGLFAVVQHYVLQSGAVELPSGDPFMAHLANYREHWIMEGLHLIPGFIFFAVAPLQFISWIRRNHAAVHRVLGRVYVFFGLLSGLIGILIAFVFPFGGWLEFVFTVPFGGFFLFAAGYGFLLARSRRIAEHRRWMIRGLAAALTISLQRVFFGVLLGATGAEDPPLMFSLAIVAAFVVMMGGAELYIRRYPQPV